MTDIIYPTHPDLTGMPAEFAQNNAAAPMANPYQTQPQNFPPQSYPQTMAPLSLFSHKRRNLSPFSRKIISSH